MAMSGAEQAQFLARAFSKFERFCGLLQVQPKEGGGRIPMVLSPIQRQYCAARTSRDIVLKPRQVYMTTLEGARDVWWFLTKPGARVVVVIQSQTDQAALRDIGYKFRIFFDSLRRVGVGIEFGSETQTEWTLPKRDATLRIIQAGASEASASKKGRGGTVNRLHISEAAFFERAEDTFNSLMESVPKVGSEVVNESTPNGAGGFYYDQWQAAVDGRSAYKPHFFPWWLHPEYRIALDAGETFRPESSLERSLVERGVPAECLKWYRWKIADKGGNADLVAQEFPSDPDTCFLTSGRTFFDTGKIKAMLDGSPYGEAWNRNGERVQPLIVFAEPERGHQYVVAADTSEGIPGGDYCTAVVYRRFDGQVAATLRGHWRPHDFAKKLVELARKYGNATIAPERNNHGSAVITALTQIEHWRAVYVHTDGKLGWNTHEVTRAPMLDALDAAVRRGVWTTADRDLLSEMRSFVVNARGKAEAAPGKHDDLVMAAAIGFAVITSNVPQRQFDNLPHA